MLLKIVMKLMGSRGVGIGGLLLMLLLSGCMQNIKEPSYAGRFYPADRYELRDMVTDLLSKAEPSKTDGRLVALIAPHAGYRFSGQTAAKAVQQLRDRQIDTVIIIGASHHRNLQGAYVYSRGGMRTPLGDLMVNEKVSQALINRTAGVTDDPAAFEKEHVIEALLPLLQGVRKDLMIVPVLTGNLSRETFDFLSKRLAEVVGADDRIMLLASTDLSHYHDYATAMNMDRKIIEALERMSPDDLEQYLTAGEGEMCGRFPVMLTMNAAARLGANSGQLYDYRNSGDATGEKDNVVGYAALGLYQKMLDEKERSELLSIARRTVDDYIRHGRVPDVTTADPRLNAYGTTFISLTRKGTLRGCIGNVRNPMPLYKSVLLNTIAASSKDHRFAPVKQEELQDLEVEVSVLSPFEPVSDIGEVNIGTHGLYLVKGKNSSIILPQVAAEAGWDIYLFLGKLAVKAGLKPEEWREAQLFRFTAEVIR
ncbi:MAG: AmmeMemoRadiSam system protein B [Nitrospirae bacterium]|nr:MAG: AmmeMemoRadiSam system protein B [Nitrospirota bacterium]